MDNINSLTVLSTLLEDYDFLFHIDFDTGKEEFYKIDSRFDGPHIKEPEALSFKEKVDYFANRFVVAEDREELIQQLNTKTIQKLFAEGKAFYHRFRVNADGKKEWYELKAAHHKDHVGKKCAIIGIRNINEEVLHQEEMLSLSIKEEQHLLAFHDIIHSGMWEIILDANSNILSVKWSKEYRKLVGYLDEKDFPDKIQSWYDKLHPDDKENAVDLFWKGAKTLEGENPFDTDFRLLNKDGFYHWYHCAGRIEPNDDGTYLYFGIFVENTAEHELNESHEIQKQNLDIIQILASEYSSVYYIDLDTDGLTPYSMNKETESEFGQIFNSGISYSEAFKLYVDKLILPEDKGMMLLQGSIKNIRESLANQKTFITQYRSSNNRYNEMKFVKVGEDDAEPKAVALGFADRDEELRRVMQEEQERQRNFDIIEILASEYSSVYYIDLTTDELNPYTMNEDTESAFGKIFRSGINYSEAYRMYVDQLILSEDKAMMLKAGSIGNIMKELRTKKTFLTTYRNSEGHYSEMKFVKVGNDDGLPTAVALGFADKDSELRIREEEQLKFQRNIDIIEILASEYTSVYYIDLTTDELDPYTMNKETETKFGSIFRSGIKYSDAFKMYVSTLVDKDDRDRMLTAGSIYNILKELSNKKTFITTYQNEEGHYSEMKFVKVGDEENPQAVALGFADKDQEIRAEMERKATSDRDAAVISGLSDDFGCVVYASYEDSSEIQYRLDPLFEKNIPGWSSIHNFEERLRTLVKTIMHPDDREAFWEATRPDVVHEAVEKENAYFVNFRTLIDGEITYYQCKFVKDEQHEDTHVIAGFHNVDAETKREMEALERANSASRAKTDFLFNMSHDIRTPMNAIIGFTNMAMKDIDNKEKVTECLEKVRLSSDMLLALINDILDMSRIESGKVKLNEEKANTDEAFDSIEPVMKELAKDKNIDIKFNIANVNNKCVYVDYARVDRILVNLISNAIKYTPAGGAVRVFFEQTRTINEYVGEYKFTISDNGIGMSKEFQEHMFEEFSREETSTNSGIQGTGLGLALAQKLVHLMDGKIECESEQGIGSTFTVTLPLHLQTEKDQKQALEELNTKEKAISLEGKRVLLVDDNELNREIGQDILEEEGMVVELAIDGKEAVEIVTSHDPDYFDFILMDIQMPIMNGYEATTKIRREMPNLDSPIIALSANAFEEDKKKSIEAGLDDHIAKPINVDQLLMSLRKFVK